MSLQFLQFPSMAWQVIGVKHGCRGTDEMNGVQAGCASAVCRTCSRSCCRPCGGGCPPFKKHAHLMCNPVGHDKAPQGNGSRIPPPALCRSARPENSNFPPIPFDWESRSAAYSQRNLGPGNYYIIPLLIYPFVIWSGRALVNGSTGAKQ